MGNGDRRMIEPGRHLSLRRHLLGERAAPMPGCRSTEVDIMNSGSVD